MRRRHETWWQERVVGHCGVDVVNGGQIGREYRGRGQVVWRKGSMTFETVQRRCCDGCGRLGIEVRDRGTSWRRGEVEAMCR